MVKLDLKYGLPFCKVTLVNNRKSISLDNVLLNTGSGGTIFKMSKVDEIDITIEEDDIIESISGVDSSEFAYKKYRLCKNLEVKDFTIEVGVMDYGFEINGILGMDLLKKIGVIINLNTIELNII